MPLLDREAKDAFFTMPITQLEGKRISIDAGMWMYANMASARKKVINRTDVAVQEPSILEIRREWFMAAIMFITGWLSYNITPVFVFDGRSLPEKADTKAKRKDKRVASRAKIDALYAQQNMDILERPANIIEELRKELRNYNNITPEEFELFKMVIRGIGVPCLQAVADAEQLCSMLCIEGKVAAVFSKDADNLIYGCPLLVRGFSENYSYDESGTRVSDLDCIRMDRVLSGLKIPHSMFVDLCIMTGCDFNKNMPKIAAVKSYGLLQKHGSIDKLPRNYDTQCLKHLRCREIFRYQPSDNLIIKHEQIEGEDSLLGYQDIIVSTKTESIGMLDINKGAIATARDYLEMAGISGQIGKLINCYQNLIPSSDGTVNALELIPIPPYVPPARPLPQYSGLLILPSNEVTPRLQASPIMGEMNQSVTKFLTLNIMKQLNT